jgi:hypothetical protein
MFIVPSSARKLHRPGRIATVEAALTHGALWLVATLADAGGIFPGRRNIPRFSRHHARAIEKTGAFRVA